MYKHIHHNHYTTNNNDNMCRSYYTTVALSIRPVSLLRLSLLRFVDSTFSENSLWAWEFHRLKVDPA